MVCEVVCLQSCCLDRCVNKYFFDSSKSSTYHTVPGLFNVQYENGKASGTLGMDTVRVKHGNNLSGGFQFGDAGTPQLVIPNTVFGQATAIDAFFEAEEEIDGVLGLAFSSLAIDGVTPPLINAINQNLLDQPIFTVYLAEDGAVMNEPGGVFTYSGLDAQHCSSQITYYALSNASYFQCPIGSVT